jgi:hypothetical protein
MQSLKQSEFIPVRKLELCEFLILGGPQEHIPRIKCDRNVSADVEVYTFRSLHNSSKSIGFPMLNLSVLKLREKHCFPLLSPNIYNDLHSASLVLKCPPPLFRKYNRKCGNREAFKFGFHALVLL